MRRQVFVGQSTTTLESGKLFDVNIVDYYNLVDSGICLVDLNNLFTGAVYLMSGNNPNRRFNSFLEGIGFPNNSGRHPYRPPHYDSGYPTAREHNYIESGHNFNFAHVNDSGTYSECLAAYYFEKSRVPRVINSIAFQKPIFLGGYGYDINGYLTDINPTGYKIGPFEKTDFNSQETLVVGGITSALINLGGAIKYTPEVFGNINSFRDPAIPTGIKVLYSSNQQSISPENIWNNANGTTVSTNIVSLFGSSGAFIAGSGLSSNINNLWIFGNGLIKASCEIEILNNSYYGMDLYDLHVTIEITSNSINGAWFHYEYVNLSPVNLQYPVCLYRVENQSSSSGNFTELLECCPRNDVRTNPDCSGYFYNISGQLMTSLNSLRYLYGSSFIQLVP